MELEEFVRRDQIITIKKILHILYAYKIIFKSLKQNKRISSPLILNRVCTMEIRKVLVAVELEDYIDIICVIKTVEGQIKINSSFISVNESEYGTSFINIYEKVKTHLEENMFEVDYDKSIDTYFITNNHFMFKHYDNELLNITFGN